MAAAVVTVSLIFTTSPNSFAEKVGSTCKKLNQKSWSGEIPIVCKKNKSGKLVWTQFSISPSQSTNKSAGDTDAREKIDAQSQLATMTAKVDEIKPKLISASNSYYESLCKGSAYATVADTWKKAVESYEKAIDSYIAAASKILERYGDLKVYAPTRFPLPAPSVCPVAIPTPKQSSPSAAPSQSSNSSAQPGETIGQFNARRSASSYLASSGFSRTGLIKQLKYEGYTDADAAYGVDAQKADWNYQAERSAASYLRSSGYSRLGLIKQLKYEGFSDLEAVHGVDAQKADWFDQAVRSAASYLRSSAFSRTGLIKQLEYEGYTNQEAIYGVDSNGFATTPPKKPSASGQNSGSTPSSSPMESGMPIVGKIVSGSDWAAYEISNSSSSNVLNHPSFLVTASTSTGAILIEGRNDKFPMLNVGGKSWMYLPFSLSLYGGSPGKITLSKYERSNNRPTSQSEWPSVSNIQLSGSQIQFSLSNNSNSLRLSGESIYYYFCLDSAGTPIFADQALTYTTLLPKGSTQISWPTKLKVGQCSLISVVVGAVYTS
jgi:hypothetical protein